MTVSTSDSRKVYAGNGSTTAFSTVFEFFEASSLVVTLVASDGTETVQTITTNYTVSGGDGSSGTVTMVTAPATGESLVIERVQPYTQDIDLIRQGIIPADSLEEQFDKIVYQVQQVKELADRTIRTTVDETSVPLSLPTLSDRKGKFIRFNATTGAPEADDGTLVITQASEIPYTGAAAPAGPGNTSAKAVFDEFYEKQHAENPFGRGGLRILVGEQDDAHYGWGGIVAFSGTGKWVHVYRKGATHGTTNNAELRARDSTDRGATWTNDRLLLQDAAADSRPSPIRHMASGRVGFWVNRASTTTNKFPLFAYSDDEGVNWTFTQVATSGITYTFADHTGILPLPASQGGDDTNGFFSIGFIDAGGIDMFKTVDNGANWTTVSNVGVASGIITQVGESWVTPIADDKYFIFSRATDGGGSRENLTVWATTDITNWGTPIDGGIPIGGGNPPGALFDTATNKIHMLQVARGNRDIDDFEHHLMTLEVDADTLWTAGGDFGSLGLSYAPLTPTPHWTTGYITPFLYDGSWYAPFTCGEPGQAGGDTAVIAMIGDFTATGAEAAQYTEYLTRSLRDVRQLDVRAIDNTATTRPLNVSNRARTASLSMGPLSMNVASGGADVAWTFADALTLAPQPSFTTIAPDNLTTTRPLRVSNNAESGELQLGAYSINTTVSTITIAIGGTDRFVLSATGIETPSGSAANPGLAFAGETNTGVYRIGSGRVGFTTQGALRFEVNGNSLRAQDAGSAAAPSYTWASDPNSGFYNIAADTIGVTVGGSEAMRFAGARNTSAVPVNLPTYTVATAPTGAVRDVIYVSDGDAGSPCLAVHNGTNWLRVSLGAAISAT